MPSPKQEALGPQTAHQSSRTAQRFTTKPKPRGRSGKSLSSGRPPLSSSSKPSRSTANGHKASTTLATPGPKSSQSSKKSSKATKALINTHHNLHKSRAKAVATGKSDLVAQIDEQIAQLGGLEAYQHASLTGQSADRGGDSSSLLVKWLEELVVETKGTNVASDIQGPRLRVLEVGALSSRNAISRAVGRPRRDRDTDRTTNTSTSTSTSTSTNTNKSRDGVLIDCVRRIDLKSQEPEHIQEIDFMQLPVPPADTEKYDVLSLSLVLNYVPEAAGRGAMLMRTRDFLRLRGGPGNQEFHGKTRRVRSRDDCYYNDNDGGMLSVLPCLFVVLPLPCLANSRYLTGERFRALMAMLGYESLKVHQSAKLHYELFRWDGNSEEIKHGFKKVEVNPGKGRNNFCIVLDDP